MVELEPSGAKGMEGGGTARRQEPSGGTRVTPDQGGDGATRDPVKLVG